MAEPSIQLKAERYYIEHEQCEVDSGWDKHRVMRAYAHGAKSEEAKTIVCKQALERIAALGGEAASIAKVALKLID